MFWRRIFVALVGALCSLAKVAQADIGFMIDISNSSRELTLTQGVAVETEASLAYAFSMLIDLENSMMQLKYADETLEFVDVLESESRRREFVVNWHYNQLFSKRNFGGVSIGLFRVQYGLTDVFDEDLYGIQFGSSTTRYMTENFFFAAQGWFKVGFFDLAEESDADTPWGYEGQLGFGFSVGEYAQLTMLAGARIRSMEMHGVIPDDDKRELFCAVRLYFPDSRE